MELNKMGIFLLVGALVMGGMYSLSRVVNRVQEWDFKTYGECQVFENNNFTVPKVKLYSDSYCDIKCSEPVLADGRSAWRMNITLPQNQTIAAQALNFNPDWDCTYKCYGRYEGYNC